MYLAMPSEERELGVEHGRHEGHRVVGLQVGGLVGQVGVGDAVALVEAVAGEGLDLVPEVRRLLRRHASAGGAVDELRLHLGHDVGLLLAHGLAQRVRVGHAEARHRHGDQHHLLLVDDDAVGLLQDRLHLGREIAELLALLALDVLVDQRHGARPVEGVQGGELFEARRLDPPQQVGHAARLKLEDAARAPLAEERKVSGSSSGTSSRSEVDPLLAHDLDRVVDDGEGAQAQEVHLQEPEALDDVHVPLGHDLLFVALGDLVEGHELVERARRDDDARGVDRGVAGQPFEAAADLDDLLDLGVLAISAASGVVSLATAS